MARIKHIWFARIVSVQTEIIENKYVFITLAFFTRVFFYKLYNDRLNVHVYCRHTPVMFSKTGMKTILSNVPIKTFILFKTVAKIIFVCYCDAKIIISMDNSVVKQILALLDTVAVQNSELGVEILSRQSRILGFKCSLCYGVSTVFTSGTAISRLLEEYS